MHLISYSNTYSDSNQNTQNIDHESRSPTGLRQRSNSHDHSTTSNHDVWYMDTVNEHPGKEYMDKSGFVIRTNPIADSLYFPLVLASLKAFHHGVKSGLSQRQKRCLQKHHEFAHAREVVQEKMEEFADCRGSKQKPSALPQASIYKKYFTESYWSELEELHRHAELSHIKSLIEARRERKSSASSLTDSDTAKDDSQDTTLGAPRESVPDTPSPVFKFCLPGRSRPAKLGLPIGYKAPIVPVDMSWRGRPEPSRFDPDIHRYGKPHKNGRPNEGAVSLEKCNMQDNENLRLCRDNYCRPDRFCRYLEPKRIKGVSRMVQCANNHQLIQGQLNEMFYGRRITLSDATKMVVCNKAQPHPRPPFFVPLHIPEAPPGYDESKWVINMSPRKFHRELRRHAPQYLDDTACDIAPLELRYAQDLGAGGAADPTATPVSACRSRDAVYFEYRDQVISDILAGRYAKDHYPGDVGEPSLFDLY